VRLAVLTLLLAAFDCSAISLGGVADNLFGTADLLSKFMAAACITAGTVLIVTAATQYKIHRQNPKLVPLSTPITYILLGLVLIGIPFVSSIFHITTGEDVAKGASPRSIKSRQLQPIDIDAPL